MSLSYIFNVILYYKLNQVIELLLVISPPRVITSCWSGPGMSSVLQQGMREDLSQLYFNHTALIDEWGIPCRVTRCGYTGEDGVEVNFIP